MSEFFGFLKVAATCGTVFFVAMLVLLSVPSSRLRLVGLEALKYISAAAMLILVPSPIDFVPDIVPGICHVDDIGYVVASWLTFRSARGNRRQRRFEQACENAQLARESGLDLEDLEPDVRKVMEG